MGYGAVEDPDGSVYWQCPHARPCHRSHCAQLAVASLRLGDRPETSEQVAVLDVYGSLLYTQAARRAAQAWMVKRQAK